MNSYEKHHRVQKLRNLPHLALPKAGSKQHGGHVGENYTSRAHKSHQASTTQLSALTGRERHHRKESVSRRRLYKKAEYERAAATPLTAAAALKLHTNELTNFEQSEILEYTQIYFVGKTPKKIQGIPQTSRNSGYDDDHGDYIVVKNDHIGYRYEVLSCLGKGSFGQVVKVFDHKTGRYHALKIIRNKKRFHQQALIEVKILECCNNWDQDQTSNIVQLDDYLQFRNHLCLVFELLHINLYEFIKNNNFRGVSLGLIRRFAIQILSCMKFIRKHRIIHCDLKPENIMLKQKDKSSIRIIDFGSSCFEDKRVYTYIQSRFYRSPEVILGIPYGVGIDLWSFACILAELFTGYPLFQGENESEQIQCVMEVCGLPPDHLLQNASRRKAFFDSNFEPKLVPNTQGMVRHPATRDLASALGCTSTLFVSFLEDCLRWDPRDRMTPSQALNHPWILDKPISPRTRAVPVSSRRRRRSSYVEYSRSETESNKASVLPPIKDSAYKHR